MELSVGNIIKRARKNKGLTQTELGELLGVGKSTIQKYENGYVKNLKLDTLRKLSDHLDLLPAMLVYPGEIDQDAPNFNLCHHKSIITSLITLNHSGQVKVHDYMTDLLLIQKYRK